MQYMMKRGLDFEYLRNTKQHTAQQNSTHMDTYVHICNSRKNTEALKHIKRCSTNT